MKYEIDLPDLTGSDGTRYEPTGEYRRPKIGDWFLDTTERICRAGTNSFSGRYIILRPVAPPYVWPEGLRGWGWAMDENGSVYLFLDQPAMRDGKWFGRGVYQAEAVTAITGHKPPVITDWRVPVRNPNWEPSE